MNPADLKQGTAEWFAARRGLPTPSRFDKILTAAKGEPAKAQDTLINELVAESLCEAPESYQSAAMRKGNELEDEARAAYQLDHAGTASVAYVGFILSGCGRFGGSPDALVGEDGGLEIKCPNPSTQIAYIRAGVLPADYRCQVHGYLIVTGRAWWDFFSYHRGLPSFRLRIERDEFTAKLATELNNFCGRLNVARAAFGLQPFPSTKGTQ